MKLYLQSRWVVGAAVMGLAVSIGRAEPPADIESALVKIGPIVDPVCTAKLYRPLMPKNDITGKLPQPYPGITVTRNQSFGPDPKDVVDVFSVKAGTNRTVLVYVPGGAGNKIEIQDKSANAFYDNIGRFATQHGMVGVLMQRKASTTWDGGAKDIAAMLQWVEAHIGDYGGNPDRIFIWAHSAGNIPLGTYLGRPELWGPRGVGIKGAILMSGAPFNIAPATVPPLAAGDVLAAAGKTCGNKVGMASAAGSDGALPGVAPGGPGGPPLSSDFIPPSGPPPSAQTQLARSSLPELQKAPFRLLIVSGELDPKSLLAFSKTLHDSVCEAGSAHCPKYLIAKGQSHVSLVFSIDTPDKGVSGPVLAFIKTTR
ncbi:MAG: carboxylesterase family protein [Steroidobacteraceae bacterium]